MVYVCLGHVETDDNYKQAVNGIVESSSHMYGESTIATYENNGGVDRERRAAAGATF